LRQSLGFLSGAVIIGSLLCPAPFDLGQHAKVVVFPVTDGEDKRP
jgi:Ni2+-binding GTPase involved in maturation of urease and hydrogenase